MPNRFSDRPPAVRGDSPWGKFSTVGAMSRVTTAREGLYARGFRCLSSSEIGPGLSFDTLEVWANGRALVYLRYNHTCGSWGILTEISDTLNCEQTLHAAEQYAAEQNRPVGAV